MMNGLRQIKFAKTRLSRTSWKFLINEWRLVSSVFMGIICTGKKRTDFRADTTLFTMAVIRNLKELGQNDWKYWYTIVKNLEGLHKCS